LPLALQARAIGARIPIHIITHGSFFGSPKFKLLMTVLRSLKNVHYLCLSATLHRTLIDRFGVSESQAHHTSYGVDTSFFHPIDSLDSRAIVVSAGAANRDYRTLVHAAAPLGVDLRIAADSAWFSTNVDITGYHLPPNVQVRSYRDYQSLRYLY